MTARGSVAREVCSKVCSKGSVRGSIMPDDESLKFLRRGTRSGWPDDGSLEF